MPRLPFVPPVARPSSVNRTSEAETWPSGEMPDYNQYAADNRLDEDRLLVSQELALTLGVQQIPALVLIDSEQKLISRELLNGPRQVAALFSAYESSHPA